METLPAEILDYILFGDFGLTKTDLLNFKFTCVRAYDLVENGNNHLKKKFLNRWPHCNVKSTDCWKQVFETRKDQIKRVDEAINRLKKENESSSVTDIINVLGPGSQNLVLSEDNVEGHCLADELYERSQEGSKSSPQERELSQQLSRALKLQSVKAMYKNQEAFKLPLHKGVLLIEDRCKENNLSDRELYDKYELLKSKVDKSVEDKISNQGTRYTLTNSDTMECIISVVYQYLGNVNEKNIYLFQEFLTNLEEGADNPQITPFLAAVITVILAETFGATCFIKSFYYGFDDCYVSFPVFLNSKKNLCFSFHYPISVGTELSYVEDESQEHFKLIDPENARRGRMTAEKIGKGDDCLETVFRWYYWQMRSTWLTTRIRSNDVDLL